MSPTPPPIIPTDASHTPDFGGKVLVESKTQTLDSTHTFLMENDTNTVYIVTMYHDNYCLSELWGQMPGQVMALPPTWLVSVSPANGEDVVTGDRSGNLKYGGCYAYFRTGSNQTFHFSTMSCW